MSAKQADELTLLKEPVDEFFDLLPALLGELAGAFPECQETMLWVSRVNVIRANGSDEKVALMRNWYDGMVCCIRDCIDKNPQPMLVADIDVLRGIGFRAKWADARMDEEARDVLFEYINRLNYAATLQFEMPAEDMPKLMDVAESLKQQVGLNIDEKTGDVHFNIQALQASLSGGMDLSALMKSMQGVMPIIQNLMGTTNGDSGNGTSGMHQYVEANMAKMGHVFPKHEG